MPFKKTNLETSLLDHVEAGDVSMKKLSFGLWYLRHRRLFLSFLIGIFVLVSMSGWIYGFYGLGHYFIFDREQDRLSLAEMFKTGVNFLAGRTNQALSVSAVKIIGDSPSSLLAEIYNPNNRATAHFVYSFMANGQAIVQRDGFVLPGQHKYLVALDQKVPAGAAVTLVISQAGWQKINPRQIADWPDFLAKHDQLIISDSQISLMSGSGQPVTQIKFQLSNRTSYGYWSVPVLILAYQGENLTSVNELVLAKLKSGETQSVSFAWPELKNADRLEIVPIIDYLDQSNYLPVAD